VHAPLKLLLDLPERRQQAIAAGLPLQQEAPLSGLAAD
jgi:hypothetical protein